MSYTDGLIVSITSFDIGFFFFQAEDGIRDTSVTGVQTCALPIYLSTYAGKTISIVFEGYTGSSYRGDIALDDIAISGSKLITGSEIVLGNSVNVFPNPTSDMLSISSSKSIQSVSIRNMSGQVVLVFNGGQNRLDVSQLNSGLYMVEVLVQGVKVSKKFIKQ